MLREGLLINMLSTPSKGTLKEEEQKQIWQRLIDFEERNTQKLNQNDVYKNVSFTYSQWYFIYLNIYLILFLFLVY